MVSNVIVEGVSDVIVDVIKAGLIASLMSQRAVDVIIEGLER